MCTRICYSWVFCWKKRKDFLLLLNNGFWFQPTFTSCSFFAHLRDAHHFSAVCVANVFTETKTRIIKRKKKQRNVRTYICCVRVYFYVYFFFLPKHIKVSRTFAQEALLLLWNDRINVRNAQQRERRKKFHSDLAWRRIIKLSLDNENHFLFVIFLFSVEFEFICGRIAFLTSNFLLVS